MLKTDYDLFTKEPGTCYYDVTDDFSDVPFFADRDRKKFDRVINNRAKTELLLKNEPLPICVSVEFV